MSQLSNKADLDELAELLAPPCQLGNFVLEGLISRTATALIFVAREDIVLKLTLPRYAPLLERELTLLNVCKSAALPGVVRPVRDELEWVVIPGWGRVATMLLPLLEGGDLVQWIGNRTTRHLSLGWQPALEIGHVVGGTLRGMLCLPRPIVYGDIKPQNVLLPRADAPLTELTLIDLDAAHQVETSVDEVSPETARDLVGDVNGFGELLFTLATGQEPPAEGEPNPDTGNLAFDTLVMRCMTSEPGASGYTSLADESLWADLERARAVQYRRIPRLRLARPVALTRPVLLLIALVLLVLLVFAVAARSPVALGT